MVVEHLTFRVPLVLQPRYLALDADIWTATLATQPGFIGKEVWADASDPDALHLIIRWISHDHWHAVPKALLTDADQRFNTAMGQTFPAFSCTGYDVL